ncbi:hypothetical protein [Curtanaerobium respiraculi]|uniref:hypothetical protein n=1 Tax=Curtanaerobium respiraculi TaxID=2949669 RepID=UPI0024B35E10|nr:hypothetical protein [Curtanaerobium respiraculi]
MARPAKAVFDLSGRSFVTVWDFMGQKLGLKGTDLAVYARIFGFHQAGREYFESKHSAAAFFGVSDRAVFDAVARLKAKGLIEETARCAEAVEIGSKCYKPAYGPLAEAGVLPLRSEEPADAGVPPHEGSSAAGWGASAEAAGPDAASSEEASEPPLKDVHPIAKADNKYFE